MKQEKKHLKADNRLQNVWFLILFLLVSVHFVPRFSCYFAPSDSNILYAKLCILIKLYLSSLVRVWIKINIIYLSTKLESASLYCILESWRLTCLKRICLGNSRFYSLLNLVPGQLSTQKFLEIWQNILDAIMIFLTIPSDFPRHHK